MNTNMMIDTLEYIAENISAWPRHIRIAINAEARAIVVNLGERVSLGGHTPLDAGQKFRANMNVLCGLADANGIDESATIEILKAAVVDLRSISFAIL
jgi:hypothetical protein